MRPRAIRATPLAACVTQICLLGRGAGGGESNVEQAAALSRHAIENLDHRRLPEAEADLRKSLALLPDQPTRLYNLACVLAGEKKNADAMEALEQATAAGFTDFTHMQSNTTLRELRALPGYEMLLQHREQIVHHAGEVGIASLKKDFGKDYLYFVDESRKLLFAVAVDQPTLEELRDNLAKLQAGEAAEIFSHPPDEFIRVILPSDADFRRMTITSAHVGGSYDDTTRTLIAQHLGQLMSHEFTHALHAADQHALRQEHPVWLSEGLASLYEAADFEDGKVVVHDNSRLPFLKIAAQKGGLLRLDQLLRMSRDDFNSRPNLAYGEASFLLRYLQEHGWLTTFYTAYTKQYSDDPSGAAALEEVSGMKLATLLKALSEWLIARPDPPTSVRPGGPVLGLALDEGVDGLRVRRVVASGPSGGNVLVGDVLVGMDGKSVRDRPALERGLAPHSAGESVSVKIRRGVSYVDVTITLGKRESAGR